VFRRSQLTLNLIANFGGAIYTGLIGLMVAPLYIRLMGIEAYGLIGFYLTLQGSLQILDFGLSPTINRELARYSVQSDKATEARDLVRTLEAGYWLLGAVIGLVLTAIAPMIGSNWIRSDTLSSAVTITTIRLMGGLAFLQWPLSLYQGGLLGLQQQVRLNVILVVLSTLRNGGALLVLTFLSRDIRLFFVWQIVMAGLQVALTTISLWRALPASSEKPKINYNQLRSSWKFAAGMSGIAVSGLILTQLDKLMLSTMLSLKGFGYYTLAGVIASSLYMLIALVFNGVFPRLTALAAADDHNAVRRLYRQSTQLMAALIWPVTGVFVYFAPQLLGLWTGDAQTADQTAPIVRLLLVGTALNGMMHVPYALQLAHGWTSLNLRLNVMLIALLVPGLAFAVQYWGATGAAAVWAILNMFYVLLGVPLTHRRLLTGEAGRWFFRGLVVPLAGVLGVVVVVGAQLPSTAWPAWTMLLSAGVIGLMAFGAAVGLAPDLRRAALRPADWFLTWLQARKADRGT
jgi:O-antigen/teichoic acid export membrane protein